MRLVKRFIVIMVVLISCVGCDQATKSMAQSHLTETDSWSFLGDAVRLQLAYNSGGFLGLGATLPAQWRVGLFSVGGALVLLVLLSYALFARAVSTPVLVAFALLLAGGVGNLADRLMNGGLVIDFINIGLGPIRTGIFNVADIAVTAGVLVLSVVMLQGSRTGSQATLDVEPAVRKERGTR
jgi:signal peptidase II